MVGNKWIHAAIGGLLCATLTFAPVHRAGAASMVDYQLLLYLVLSVVSILEDSSVHGSDVVATQLQAAAAGAEASHLIGNRSDEISRLSKTIGAAEALIGMTLTCDGCGDVRETLQQVIGAAAFLKTSAVGASGSCQPNGIVGPGEQCDPLAAPTGCAVGGITATYCTDECRCQSPGVPNLLHAVTYTQPAASDPPACAGGGQASSPHPVRLAGPAAPVAR